MVAMGSSLADRAWGRDSAVYRISGVFAVVAGWFMTALIAFTVSTVIAWTISIGGMWVIIGLIAIALILVIRTHVIFRRRMNKTAEEEEMINETDGAVKRVEKCTSQVLKTVTGSERIFTLALDSFLNEDIVNLREAMDMERQFDARTKKQKGKIVQTISKMKKVDLDSGYFYIQVVDYQREMAHSLHFMVEPLMEHLANQHKPFTESQANEIRQMISESSGFFNLARQIVREEKFSAIDELVALRLKIFETIYNIEKDQVRRIKDKEVNTRNSLLFFKALAETKNLLLQAVNLLKSHRDFIHASRKIA
mgnify:CR=1 FL=1